MATPVPRFEPIDGGSGIDSPADYQWSSAGSSTGNRRRSHWRTRMATYAIYHTYRLRVAIFSGATFIAGTGFTIYNATLGR